MPDPDSPEKPRTGRVRHDSGGRAIWEWAVESGRHAVDSTSLLLKKLELTGLTLMGDEKPWDKKSAEGDGLPRMPVQEQRKPASPLELPPEESAAGRGGGGFNPYDTRTPVGRPAAAKKPSIAREPAPPAKKPGFFARLFGRR